MRTVKEIEQQAERAWARGVLEERERGRTAELMQKPPPNDARLLAPTRCAALKPFYVGGTLVEVGHAVTLDRDTARSLEALNKVSILQA